MSPVDRNLGAHAKAIVAGLAAAIAFAIPIVDDGLVASEVLGILAAFLAGGGVTWTVPNRPKNPA